MENQGRKTLKTTLLCLSHFQSLLGVVVGLAGLYVWLKYKENSLFFHSSSNITLLIFFILITGVLLLFSGFLGSWVSSRNSACLQGSFLYVLVVLFCLGSTASALALYHSYYVDSEVHPLSGVFQNYTGSSQDPGSRAVDVLQESMECCGVKNYTDWWDTSWFKHTGGYMPLSCCNKTFGSCTFPLIWTAQINNVGCQEKLQHAFHFLLVSIVVRMFALIFVMEVILVVTTVRLMKEPLLHHYVAL